MSMVTYRLYGMCSHEESIMVAVCRWSCTGYTVCVLSVYHGGCVSMVVYRLYGMCSHEASIMVAVCRWSRTGYTVCVLMKRLSWWLCVDGRVQVIRYVFS